MYVEIYNSYYIFDLKNFFNKKHCNKMYNSGVENILYLTNTFYCIFFHENYLKIY